MYDVYYSDYWQTEDRKTLIRNPLMNDISRNGDEGVVKTELISGSLAGY